MLPNRVRTSWSIGMLALLLPFAVACGDAPTGPSNGGRLAVRLTDAPIQNVSEVNVYIEGLRVKHVGEPEQRLSTDIGLIDLLELEDSTMLLVEASVAAGEYEYIMIELDQERSHLTLSGAQQVGVRIPSEKIKVFGPFTVEEDVLTTVTLDFDAGDSLQQLGNGDWLMTPIIVLLGAQIS